MLDQYLLLIFIAYVTLIHKSRLSSFFRTKNSVKSYKMGLTRVDLSVTVKREWVLESTFDPPIHNCFSDFLLNFRNFTLNGPKDPLTWRSRPRETGYSRDAIRRRSSRVGESLSNGHWSKYFIPINWLFYYFFSHCFQFTICLLELQSNMIWWTMQCRWGCIVYGRFFWFYHDNNNLFICCVLFIIICYIFFFFTISFVFFRQFYIIFGSTGC